MTHDHGEPEAPPSFWGSRYAIGVIVMGAAPGHFLLTEHLAYVVGALTIYLLMGWLQTTYPALDILSHDAGHLWPTLLDEKGNPHLGVLHIASYIFLAFRFFLLSSAWNVLYHAQRRHALATAGPYAVIRHAQYVAFVLIMLGFLPQWPTLLTLIMFPILLVMYGRLALTEKTEMRRQFGDVFERYAQRTPRFIPGRPLRSAMK